MQVLMLSAGMIPFDTCSVHRSITMLYERTAHSIQDSTRVVRSPSVVWAVPSILRVPSMGYVPVRKANFSRLNVLYRDEQRCQYCGVGPLPINKLQLEHVIPISRFDKIAKKRGVRYAADSFENCVATCSTCNHIKANRLPEELGWKLLRKPFVPTSQPYVAFSRREADALGWTPFLEPFTPKFVRLF